MGGWTTEPVQHVRSPREPVMAAAVRYDSGPAGRSLTGRTALVTGGGSGLGRAIARRLAAGGATVVVADIDANGAADTVKLVTEAGGQARDISLDVADPQSVAAAVAAVFEEFGDSVDLLVNNAGTDRGAGILDLTEEQWQHVIGVNQVGSALHDPGVPAAHRGRRSPRVPSGRRQRHLDLCDHGGR